MKGMVKTQLSWHSTPPGLCKCDLPEQLIVTCSYITPESFLSSEKHFDLRGALYSQHLRLRQRSDTVLTDIKVHFPARFSSLKWERVSRADSHS